MKGPYTITYIATSLLEEVYKRDISSKEEALRLAENYHHRNGCTVTVYDDSQKEVVKFEVEETPLAKAVKAARGGVVATPRRGFA